MLQLIDCKVSFFCLLCFPSYTICWGFFILSKKEQMKSKLSPWACEIVCLYNLQSQSFLIFYWAFNLWQVYALKLMYQWKETRNQCLGGCQVRTVVEITHFTESNPSSSESSKGLDRKQTSFFPSTALENCGGHGLGCVCIYLSVCLSVSLFMCYDLSMYLRLALNTCYSWLSFPSS